MIPNNHHDTGNYFLYLLKLKQIWLTCGDVIVITSCERITTFSISILRKIINIAATRCHILKLKCTKFEFGSGSAPDPARGAYSAPQTP